MRNDKLVETDNGLWNTRVEEELNDFADKKDNISQVRSEAGKKVRKQNQAIKNQNKNIYKKTKTIVLAKKKLILKI